MVTPSSSQGSVDALFERWLDERDAGGEAFEDFVARHPAEAAELRGLFAAWRTVSGALPGSASAPPTATIGAILATHASRGSGGALRPALAPGSLVGDYRLLQLLGAGGMGQVWEAEQLSLGRRVALKTLRPDAAQYGGARLWHEARAAGGLNHPGIVPVFAAGEAGGVHFLAQQLVGDGTTLDALIEQRRSTGVPDATGVAALFLEIAQALAAAHAQGILHRDLKPRNILLDTGGRPRVGDFGLALRLGEGRASGLAGTCAYMSPEQAEGGATVLDARSDVFSLGAVLYEMLTLRRPFDGDSTTDVLEAVRHARPQDPAHLRRDVPRDLAAVCLKAMEKDPAERYADMLALADDLRRFLAHEPVRARRSSAASRTWKWSRRHPARAVALLLGGVSLVVVASLLVRESGLRHVAEERAIEARAQGYLANLRAAAALIGRGNPVEARARLQACAPELRGWEWRYASLLVDSSVLLLEGHVQGATAVALTPDGRRIVTGDGAGDVRVWSSGGRLLAQRPAGQGAIRRLACSEDGRLLVVGGETGSVRLRDAHEPGGDELIEVGAALPPAEAVAVSADGSRALAWAPDGTLSAWPAQDPAAAPVLLPRVGGGGGLASAALSVPAALLVTGSQYGAVNAWSLATDELPLVLHGYERASAQVAVSADGTRVAAGLPDGSVHVWSWPEALELAALAVHGRAVGALALSADGRYAVSAAAGDEPVAVLDLGVPEGARVALLSGHAGRVAAVGISADGLIVTTACVDGRTYLWNRAEPVPVHELVPPGERPRSFSVSADGRVLAWCDGLGPLVTVRDGGVRGTFDLGPAPLICVDVSAEGLVLVAGRADGAVARLDLRTDVPLAPLAAGPDAVAAVAVVEQGARLLAATGADLVVLTPADGSRRVLRGHTAAITGLSATEDGRLAATTSIDGTVRLWNLPAGTSEVLQRGEPFDDHVAVLDPSGRLLAVALAAGGTVRLLDTATGQPLCQLTDLESGVPSLAFGADGRRLFTGSYNGRYLRVWDAALGENLFDFPDHSDGTTALACAGDSVFSVAPDGRVLVRTAAGP